MEIFIIISVILAGVVIALLFKNNQYKKTLHSKKRYEELNKMLTAERLLVEEDRIHLSTKEAMLSLEVNALKIKIEEHLAQARKVADDSETLAHKYIKSRIELLKLTHPDLANYPEKIEEVRGLLDQRIKGDITLFRFVDQIEIFIDKLSREVQ